jgi:haloalkane dehalogenase
MSFSWAMSVFGVQQMASLLAPSKAAKAFDGVTEATEGEMAQSLQSIFKTGDNLQRTFVDMIFGAAAPIAFPGGRPANATTAPPQGKAYTPPPQTAPSSTGWNAIPASTPAATQAPTPPPTTDTPQRAGIPREADISAEYPFQPHYVEVLGSKMHYIEEGKGDTIVFLHGNPTWSYLWRNVVPHLAPHGRCIAPDLMGYGRSEKPEIDYRWAQQAEYVEEFFRKLNLKDVTLVLHDWGVSLGLNYAMHHEKNVKAIAFMEGIFRTFPRWEDFSTPEFRELFKKFRVGGQGGEGWKLLVDQNFFIEHLLSGGVGRQLSEKEMRYYREPFSTPSSRIPIWSLARSVPVAGKPKEVWDGINEMTDRLKQSRLPKLLLYATPGGIVTAESVDWCRQNLKNFESVDLGPGLHYVQETTPHLIGREVADWYKCLGSGR